MKKVKKLSAILMSEVASEFIPSEIKIPVVSTLGIKAIIKIEEIDYTPFTETEQF